MAIQIEATKQYFPVVLFIMMHKVVLTFESVDEILQCDHSNGCFFVLWKALLGSYCVVVWVLFLGFCFLAFVSFVLRHLVIIQIKASLWYCLLYCTSCFNF